MYDVIILGGSYAGLAAALQLGRARRRVLILDAGERRNRFAKASHGFLGQDGVAPGVIAAKGRAEVLAYPTVTLKETWALNARAIQGSFSVRIEDEEFPARRLIIATGVVDDLPPLPGLAECWGKTAFFCPYCDGYEFDRGRLGTLATSPTALHHAVLVSEWAGPGQATFFLNGAFEPDDAQRAELEAHDIRVERALVTRVNGTAGGIEVELADGRTTPLDGFFLLPRTRHATPFATQLGCELDEGPMGPFIKTDAMKETTVTGVFACGDVALPMGSVSFAVADGVRAGTAAHQSLVFRRDE